jgi:adenine-specific DNA-methyltransferase
MNRTEIIQKLKQLEGISQDERAYLINLVNTKKKYGLVWEDKPEVVEEQLRTQLPVLREVVERRILSKELPSESILIEQKEATLFSGTEIQEIESLDNGLLSKDKSPNHILIEGDNLHALTALSFTHEGMIDVMYFDPPYNTGNKDFKYNDSFVDREDSYRHSKWLSFMNKRLLIAKRLLSDKGVIFISIDDNEQAQIKLLCDEVFSEKNFLGLLPTIMNLKGNQDQFCFAGTHEYTIVYCKDKSTFSPNQFSFDSEELEEWAEDEIGLFKKGAPLRATGAESNREDRPLMFFPILIDINNNVKTITEEEYGFIFDNKTKIFDDTHLSMIISKYKELGFEVILPYVDVNQYGRWRWGFNTNTINRLDYDVIPSRTKNGISLYKKQRPELGDLPSKKPKSVFYKPEYSSGNGTSQLKDIMKEKMFNNPKPIDLIKDIITISSSRKDFVILDIFAGSGTTLNATMRLNAEDGGTRQCILVTNNENNICEEVTFERNRRVIQGYTNSKGNLINGLTNNNLRYYKCEFVPSMKTEPNKRLLTQTSTDLLCIKEDCYTDITEKDGFNPLLCKVFTNDCGKYMIIVYHSRNQIEVCEQLIAYIKNINDLSENIKLYAFSPEKETLLEDFYEVADKIDAIPLPEAIYNAYRSTFKTLNLDKKPPASIVAVSEGTEFSNELFDIIQEED